MTMPHTPYLAAGPDVDGPRRALILAGGGMRVAYQAGVLQALDEAGLRFSYADGTSGGIMNVAMLCSGLAPHEMAARWRALDVGEFVSFRSVRQYLKGPQMGAMGDADGIRRDVFPHLGIDVPTIRAAEGLDARFNVCNFTQKTNEAIPHPDVTLDHLIAGISLPIFLPAVDIDGTTYTDAVWIQDANLLDAVRNGAQELWVVWIIGNTPVYSDGLFEQYVHMIEMSACGALHRDFARIRAINARILQGERVHGHTKPIRLHLIKPPTPLPLDPAYFFGAIDGASLVNMGYADAKAYLDRMAPDGLPFHPETTQMDMPNPGIRFRETMEGAFALGTTEPEDGAERGRRDGHTLALHATISIDDIDRFVDDPDHAGRLDAHVDFTPFGEGIPGHRGVFNLFAPSDAPDTKWMVYEVAFRHDGQDYYLAGKKRVRDDPGFDLWSDTTTLYTRLHEGPDASGSVVGAGVLRLGVDDLVRLVSTMRATNADALAEKTRAIGTFGRFFLGELWSQYASQAPT